MARAALLKHPSAAVALKDPPLDLVFGWVADKEPEVIMRVAVLVVFVSIIDLHARQPRFGPPMNNARIIRPMAMRPPTIATRSEVNAKPRVTSMVRAARRPIGPRYAK